MYMIHIFLACQVVPQASRRLWMLYKAAWGFSQQRTYPDGNVSFGEMGEMNPTDKHGLAGTTCTDTAPTPFDSLPDGSQRCGLCTTVRITYPDSMVRERQEPTYVSLIGELESGNQPIGLLLIQDLLDKNVFTVLHFPPFRLQTTSSTAQQRISFLLLLLFVSSLAFFRTYNYTSFVAKQALYPQVVWLNPPLETYPTYIGNSRDSVFGVFIDT
ncbi:hypothetical protein ACRALDRAFT_2015160 [Sodiomyces alcalophilus JCM 7366]|uniref:uncharacterized protein n=1 Tax=Sodiomyces alcalophilus JCM 7366 TaxID=591952 RepID=UPI0039B550EC